MRIDRNSPDFYKVMGPVFGSRLIQRQTNDRFYDDPGKEWFIERSSDHIDYVISVKDGVIKNVYLENGTKAIEVLKAIYPDIISGIVPACYAGVYMDAGYLFSENSTNFVSIKGGFHGED